MQCMIQVCTLNDEFNVALLFKWRDEKNLGALNLNHLDFKIDYVMVSQGGGNIDQYLL